MALKSKRERVFYWKYCQIQKVSIAVYRNGTKFGSERLEVNKSGFCGNDPSLKVFQRNLSAGQLQCTKKNNASYMSARGQRLF